MSSARLRFYIIAPLAACAGLLAAAGTAPPPAHAEPSPRPIDSLSAGYVHRGGAEDLKARDTAIEYTIGTLPGLFRPIARRRLKKVNVIFKSVVIDVRDKAVTVSVDGRPFAGTLGGPPSEVIGRKGKKLALTYLARGDALVQEWVGENWSRTNIFRRAGDRLVIEATIVADKLPRTLEYKLHYVTR